MKLTALAFLGTAFSTLGLAAPGDAPQHSMLEAVSYQDGAQAWGEMGDISQPGTAQPNAEGDQEEFSFGDTWDEVEDTNRHILIMASVDGFTAAGPNGPCFKGGNNSTIDKSLKDAGFGSKSPSELAKTLATLPEASTDCAERGRSYSTALIQGMTDEHLSIYLTGAVSAYATQATCPVDRHESAAMSAAAAILSASPDGAPADVLRATFAEACLPANQ